MPHIHLVERMPNVTKIDREKNVWESKYWLVDEETAQKLIGGQLYLHSGKQQPSHFGGEILSYRVHDSGEKAGHVIFAVRANADCKGVKAVRTGWKNDSRIVWETDKHEESKE
jgi:hypothetical protein